MATDPDVYEKFAKAYGDPTQPTYNNAKATYLVFHPDADPAYAGRQGSRMLKDERTIAFLQKYRQTSRTLAGLTHEDFLAHGWQLLQDLVPTMMENPKALSGYAKLYETVGKAGGFLTTKTEDVTPYERKAPISSAEAKTLIEARLERMNRLNAPNPIPGALPSVTATVVEDAAFSVIEASDLENDQESTDDV